MASFLTRRGVIEAYQIPVETWAEPLKKRRLIPKRAPYFMGRDIGIRLHVRLDSLQTGQLVPVDCDFVGPDGKRNPFGSWSWVVDALESSEEMPLIQAGTPGIHRYDVRIGETPIGTVAIYDVLSTDGTALALVLAFIGLAATIVGAVISALLGVILPVALSHFHPTPTPTPTATALSYSVGQPVPLADPTTPSTPRGDSG